MRKQPTDVKTEKTVNLHRSDNNRLGLGQVREKVISNIQSALNTKSVTIQKTRVRTYLDDVGRSESEPLTEGYILEDGTLEDLEELERSIADILEVVAVRRRDIADIPSSVVECACVTGSGVNSHARVALPDDRMSNGRPGEERCIHRMNVHSGSVGCH